MHYGIFDHGTPVARETGVLHFHLAVPTNPEVVPVTQWLAVRAPRPT